MQTTSVAESNPVEPIEFRPRPSSGKLWTSATGGVTLALFLIPVVLAWDEIPTWVIAFMLLLAVAVTAPVFLVTAGISGMRYQIFDDELVLEFPRMMEEQIPIADIETIQRRDLRPSLLASFRFPGVAVLDVEYLDLNRVRMCATAAANGILIITTAYKRYGVTPADERSFVDELVERSGGTIQVLPPVERGSGT